jgi:hypothetical protein
MKQILNSPEEPFFIEESEYLRLRETIKDQLLTVFDEIQTTKDATYNEDLISFVGVKYYDDRSIKWKAVSVFFAKEYYDYLLADTIATKLNGRLITLRHQYNHIFKEI